jgi:glycosyltransferase involved in cell wall biosynthesis
VITHYFPSHGGGIELVTERLVAELSGRGTLIQWLSSNTDPPPQPRQNVAIISGRAFNCIERLTQLPYPIWSLSTLRPLWKAIGRADVVYIHEHLYFGSIFGVLAARLRRRPVVITQHTGAVAFRTRSATAIYRVLTRAVGRVIFALATRIVFISANVRSFFDLENCPRVSLIFNGIDPARFAPASTERRQAIRERLGVSPERLSVLFVGRFVKKKGLHILELLTLHCPDILWILVGSGPEDPANWKRDNVITPGRLAHDRLPEMYQAADLLVLPSFTEGFPLVVQEALACGLGVLSTEEVATACPAARHMIRTWPTPRFQADASGWEAAIREALADRRYLEAREERSTRAHNLWSWEQCASRYLDIFDDLALRVQTVKSHQKDSAT